MATALENQSSHATEPARHAARRRPGAGPREKPLEPTHGSAILAASARCFPAARHRSVGRAGLEVCYLSLRSVALIRHPLKFAMTVLVAGGFSFPSDDAFAQAANELVGSWTLVSITVKQGGQKLEPFGPTPKGLLIFDRSGRVSIIVTRPDLPKFQSNNRSAGTPEEERAIVQGSIAYFGTYSVNEEDRAFIVHVEGSTFPNWVGTDQKRIFTITGGELKYTNSNRSGGAGTALVVWKRVK
jgi:hypothetical protein